MKYVEWTERKYFMAVSISLILLESYKNKKENKQTKTINSIFSETRR